MTSLVSPDSLASVYGSHVADQHEAKFERARARIRAEQEAERAHDDAIEARNEAVLAAYKVAPKEWSDNAVARALGLNPSTLRSIVPKAERRSRE